MNNELPIIYSFRRCPYAIRARTALYFSNINCIIREVDLKNKPTQMIEISPKATVPVLLLPDGKVIDESIDIIFFALEKNDQHKILLNSKNLYDEVMGLIKSNDTEFATLLRKYKYHQRHPEEEQVSYRKKLEDLFLSKYEEKLSNQEYLTGNLTIADIAIMPFIRQFALVDDEWFFNSKYKNIIRWLNNFIDTDYFNSIIMKKFNPWQDGDRINYFL